MSARLEQAGVLMRRAAIASVCVSLLLVAIKTVAYFASNSVALLASLADSALDLFTSSLNLFAIREALAPPDREHRFGHGKAEPLAGLAQAAFITASALFLVLQGAERLMAPEPLDHELLALAVMGVSILLAIGLILYERHVVRKTSSVAVGADQMHYLGDLAANAGVVVAILLVSGFGWIRADPVIALGVSGIMLWSGWAVGRQSLDQLMDRELPDEDRARIAAMVRRHAEVKSLHDLRTRAAGLSTFIQLHIELEPSLTLARAHEISDAVEATLLAAWPGAQVIIHQDPAGLEMPPSESIPDNPPAQSP